MVAPDDHALAVMMFIPPSMPAMIVMSVGDIPSVIITVIAGAVVSIVTDANAKSLGASDCRGR
jgi:type III secretory pathway component EscV